jgi:GTP pyrophosphokinase
MDFVNDFRLNLFNDEIYIFTPKGELRVLPIGSTILDFAYDIHTDIGDKCIGAKVNNRLMPLSYQLINGDQLEIITSPKQKPNEEWLRFVVTARAKQKIKSSLNEERNIIVEDGKEILLRKFKQFNLRSTNHNISFLERYFNLSSTSELYFRIAKGKIDLAILREQEIVDGNIKLTRKDNLKKPNLVENNFEGIDTKHDTILIGDDFKGFEYHLAKCCNPIPGDIVFGFITMNDGIKIHRGNCPNAGDLLSKLAFRCIKAKWKQDKLVERIAAIKIIGIDQIGLVNKLTDIISKQNNINMKSISFETTDGVFEGRIKVLVFDTEHLEQLTNKFGEVEGVQRVTRWDTEEDSQF